MYNLKSRMNPIIIIVQALIRKITRAPQTVHNIPTFLKGYNTLLKERLKADLSSYKQPPFLF